jgi:hypothetical protein
MRLSLRGFIGVFVVLVAINASAATAEMPDILGIQLGMPAREAHAKLQTELPKNKIQVISTNLPTLEKPVMASFVSEPTQTIMIGMVSDRVTVDVTLPPNKQSVWRVDRSHSFPDKGIPRGTLLAQLREKYGKETRAMDEAGNTTTEDRQVRMLWWFLDEQGRLVKPTPVPSGADPFPTCRNDTGMAWSGVVESPLNMLGNKDRLWCLSSYTAVFVGVSPGALPELYDKMYVSIVSLPMGSRAGNATLKWKNDIAEGKQKQDIEKAKQQEKPKL